VFDETTGELRESGKNTEYTKELIALCDVQSIPLATNVKSAEIMLNALSKNEI
jgi:methylglyoxal synthase